MATAHIGAAMPGLETSEALIARVTAAFAAVRGVAAIVLGGSRGRDVHHAGSDYDFGLYYWGKDGIDFDALNRAAEALDDGARRAPVGQEAQPLMTGPGGWGAWVNGGGWLTVDGEPVDVMYRELERVDRVIADCHAGTFECAYHYGHPHAFVSHMYAGELATSRVVHDPSGLLAARKAKLTPYPEPLAAAVTSRFLDEAQFFLAIAEKAATKGDITYVTGCAYRTTACLLQAIFGLNRQWLLNEKGALALAATFAKRPKDLKPRLEAAFAGLSTEAANLQHALRIIADLANETRALA